MIKENPAVIITSRQPVAMEIVEHIKILNSRVHRVASKGKEEMTLTDMETIQVRLSWKMNRTIAAQCYCYGVDFNECVVRALRAHVEYEATK